MTSVLAFPLAAALSVDPSASRGRLDIKLPSARSAADLIPETRGDVLHQPGPAHSINAPLARGKTAALFTLVAAPRPLKHHLCSPSPRREERPRTGQAPALLAELAPSYLAGQGSLQASRWRRGVRR